MNDNDLKPCPFCGSKPHIWYAPQFGENEMPIYGVICHSCHMFVKYGDLPPFKGKVTIGDIQRAVVNRWNRRQTDAP